MKFDLDDKQLLGFYTQASKKGLDVTPYLQDLLTQLHGKIVAQENFQISIEDKIQTSSFVIEQMFDAYTPEKISVAWTGGKDSTLLLWLVRKVCKQKKMALPKIVFIDEGDVFEEVYAFAVKLASDWKFDYRVIKNEDVLKQVTNIGDTVDVTKLSVRNRAELKRLQYSKNTFEFRPESMEGNHLMKTVVQHMYIEETGTQVLVTGIRWDEQEARSSEMYFSKRGDSHTPTHMRVHPLLHMTEADIWKITKDYKIPFCDLYKEGYRSLGAKSSTTRQSSVPAWEQDLEETQERAGRAQDKEAIMKRLRDLGYM